MIHGISSILSFFNVQCMKGGLNCMKGAYEECLSMIRKIETIKMKKLTSTITYKSFNVKFVSAYCHYLGFFLNFNDFTKGFTTVAFLSKHHVSFNLLLLDPFVFSHYLE